MLDKVLKPNPDQEQSDRNNDGRGKGISDSSLEKAGLDRGDLEPTKTT